MTKLTKGSTYSSVLVLSFVIPSVVFGIFSGVVVDLWSKRLLLIWTNVARMLLAKPCHERVEGNVVGARGDAKEFRIQRGVEFMFPHHERASASQHENDAARDESDPAVQPEEGFSEGHRGIGLVVNRGTTQGIKRR